MKLLRLSLCAAVALAFTSIVSGCSGGSKGPVEKLVGASGLVKLDGKPAEKVRIRLTPINDTKSVGGAWAVTGDDGKFSLTHWTNQQGIAPGTYLITFSKLVKPDGSPLGEMDSPALVQAKEVVARKWSNPEPDHTVAPARRVDIPEGGKSDLEFSITSAKK